MSPVRSSRKTRGRFPVDFRYVRMLREARSIEELRDLISERDPRVHRFGSVDADGWNIRLHVALLEQRREQPFQLIDIQRSLRYVGSSAHDHKNLRPDGRHLFDLDLLDVSVLKSLLQELRSGNRQCHYRPRSIADNEGGREPFNRSQGRTDGSDQVLLDQLILLSLVPRRKRRRVEVAAEFIHFLNKRQFSESHLDRTRWQAPLDFSVGPHHFQSHDFRTSPAR